MFDRKGGTVQPDCQIGEIDCHIDMPLRHPDDGGVLPQLRQILQEPPLPAAQGLAEQFERGHRIGCRRLLCLCAAFLELTEVQLNASTVEDVSAAHRTDTAGSSSVPALPRLDEAAQSCHIGMHQFLVSGRRFTAPEHIRYFFVAHGLVRLYGEQPEQCPLLQRHGHGQPRAQNRQRPQQAYFIAESGLVGLRIGVGLAPRSRRLVVVPDHLGHPRQGLVARILHLATFNMTDGSDADFGPSRHFVLR